MTLQWLLQSQSKRSLGEFSVLRYSNHFLLVGMRHCSLETPLSFCTAPVQGN